MSDREIERDIDDLHLAIQRRLILAMSSRKVALSLMAEIDHLVALNRASVAIKIYDGGNRQ